MPGCVGKAAIPRHLGVCPAKVYLLHVRIQTETTGDSTRPASDFSSRYNGYPATHNTPETRHYRHSSTNGPHSNTANDISVATARSFRLAMINRASSLCGAHLLARPDPSRPWKQTVLEYLLPLAGTSQHQPLARQKIT